MQTLGLSESTPKPQNRLKSLFWPSINNDVDVDSLARQGFWLCMVVAALSLMVGLLSGNLLAITLDVLFYSLCGIGIRVNSRSAGVAAFCAYLLSVVILARAGQFGIVRIFALALLLANVRGTFLAAQWVATRTEPPPLPQSRTIWERFADVMPRKMWPIGQYVFYLVAGLEMLGLAMALFRVS